MYKKNSISLAAVALLLFSNFCFSMNMVRPYEFLFQAERKPDYKMQVTTLGEFSFGHAKGYDENGCDVNILRIYNPDQNALKMLDGFDDTTAIGQKRIQVNANDDGKRGHYLVCGDLSMQGLSFSGRWALPKHFSVRAHIPFYFAKLKSVSWMNQTEDITVDDARVRNYLTDDFFANVCTLGKGLDLGCWSRSGAGDLTILLEWLQNFRQTKPFLKNVRVRAYAGWTTPTGKWADEDKIFAFPFGSDGSFGFLFGAGLDLTFRTYLRAGLDVQLLHLGGKSKCRRIKTNENQTELLLLEKVNAFREYGFSQQFTLYAQGCNFLGGLAATVGYQFFKHGDDYLTLRDLKYSEKVANTAKSLEEWTMHNFIFKLSYDFSNDYRVHPYLAAFVKVPFNGIFSAQVKSLGFILGVDF